MIPEIFTHKLQTYHNEGTVPHVMDSGREIKLHVLRTACPHPGCGKEFRLYATASAIKARTLRRRCDEHKKPGVPVEPALKSPARFKTVKPKKAKATTRTRRKRPPKPAADQQTMTMQTVTAPPSPPTNWSKRQSDAAFRDAIGMLVDEFARRDDQAFQDSYATALEMLE